MEVNYGRALVQDHRWSLYDYFSLFFSIIYQYLLSDHTLMFTMLHPADNYSYSHTDQSQTLVLLNHIKLCLCASFKQVSLQVHLMSFVIYYNITGVTPLVDLREAHAYHMLSPSEVDPESTHVLK